MKLGVSVIPKISCVIFHTWSEQTGGIVQHDFKETWKRYKVNDTDREIYEENLRKAFSAYNSEH